MEVTKTNFSELVPEITEVINNASFLCVDGEFTGLNDGEEVTAYDTPAQYYHKLREGAMSFLFFQFGLAAFQYDAEKDRYTHRAYNFYLFPRPMNRYAKDCRFLCQSSSVDFLAEQGFDFNKVFKEGIPYLSDPDEQTARENLEERRKRFNATGDIIPVPNDLKRCVENACEQVQQFIDSGKEQQEIILERPTSFARRLFYQEAKQRFSPDQVALETKKWVVVARRIGGPEQRLKEEEERRVKEDLELDTAVGFSRIIRALSKSGKFIVGHNLLLDLLHIIRQFYMPLPDDYEEFKELLHNLFPKVIDTKYMCSAPPFKDILSTTVLVNLLEALKAPPFNLPTVECEDGHGYQSLDVKHHEAGFDAYSTGLVFIALGNFLKKSRVFMDKQNASITESPLVEPYLNRLYLMRVIDVHICLSGEDPNPYRDHVFLMTFPKEWKHNEINRVFAAYGGIFTHWINDTSAWIALQHREQYQKVKNNLIKNLNDPNVTLVHYADVQNQINNSRNETVHEKSTPLFNKTFSSPATSAARKRFSDGNKSSNEAASNQKRQKRESLGKRTWKMVILGIAPTTALTVMHVLCGLFILFILLMLGVCWVYFNGTGFLIHWF